MSEDFQVNDLVWAKMKSYPPWPAKIVKPSLSNAKHPKSKKASFVQFFGDNKFAWIPKKNITPHSQSILSNLGNKKSAPYQRAIEKLLTFSKSSQKDAQNSARHVEATVSIKDESIDDDVKDIPKKEKESSIIEEEKEDGCGKMEILPKKEIKCPKDVKGRKGSLRSSAKKTGSTRSKKVTPKRLLNIKVKEEPGECTAPQNQKLMEEEGDHHLTYFRNLKNNNISVWEDDSVPYLDSYIAEDPEHYTTVRGKHITPKKKRIGFVGLGNIGRAAVHNLLMSGYDITIWNKTTQRCALFVTMGAKMAESPADIIRECNLTYCSVSDQDASKNIVFGDRGILKGLEQAQKLDKTCRGYIEMSSIDPETSRKINDAIVTAGGKYLEAPICGDNTNGIIVIAAGDKELFFNSLTFFQSVVKHAHFISYSVGLGSQVSLLLRMFSGAMYVAIAEILGLAASLGIEDDDFLEVLEHGPLQFPNIIEKCRRMMNSDFKTVTPLKHIQKDLNLTLQLGNQFSQHMPVTAAANQLYKHAKSLNYSDLDVSAVYQALHY